jgi:DMSO/TMAO reductase YedYZ molybdopterin-dependent catalytic subunit
LATLTLVKSAVVDLLAELAAVGVATVAIEVRHGLPARLIVEEVTHG